MNKKLVEKYDDNPGAYFGMLVESVEDNKLEEADTLAKPFRKDIKNDYKRLDKRIDDAKKYNADQEKEIQAIAKKSSFSDKDTELFRKLFYTNVPKHSKKRTFEPHQELEKNKYPFYVTHYEEIPYYHPEEGGYFVAGMQAVSSKGFDNKQDAVAYAEEEFGDYMERFSDGHYTLRSKYIGESEHVYIETEKDYLSREKGDTQYESLTESSYAPDGDTLGDMISTGQTYREAVEDAIEECNKHKEDYVILFYSYPFTLSYYAVSEREYNENPDVWYGGKIKARVKYEDGKSNVYKESLKEDKFVPQDKMSKKAQKELNAKKRNTWGNTNPVTKVQPNKKVYDRKRDKKVVDEALNMKIKRLNEAVLAELSNDDFMKFIDMFGKIEEEVAFVNHEIDNENKLITYNDVSYYADNLQKLVDGLKQIYSSWIVN